MAYYSMREAMSVAPDKVMQFFEERNIRVLEHEDGQEFKLLLYKKRDTKINHKQKNEDYTNKNLAEPIIFLVEQEQKSQTGKIITEETKKQ